MAFWNGRIRWCQWGNLQLTKKAEDVTRVTFLCLFPLPPAYGAEAFHKMQDDLFRKELFVMRSLLSISLALFAGLMMTRVFKVLKLRFPDVTAFLIAGLFIGPYGLGRLGYKIR